MIRSISLTNFKCFRSLHLELAPLTLLCGVNGMGKSSLLQALLALRQSAAAGVLQQGHLILDDELADLGTGRDALYEFADEEVIEFRLADDRAEEPLHLAFDYAREADRLQVRGTRRDLLGSWEELPPFSGLHYVAAERIGPRKIHEQSDTAALQRVLGSRGEHTMNYLDSHREDLLAEQDARRAAAVTGLHRDVVDYWLQEVTPGASLKIERIQDADALIGGFTFARTGDVETRRYRATNVGFGLSYVLPVIAALLAPTGTLCLLENPEAHLHPRGQTRMAELAARAAAAGVQVLVETHSDHFLDGVRIAVQEGSVAPEATRFHYFEQENGQSVVRTPRINAEGQLSSWPDGFFDQHALNLARLLTPRS